MFRETQSPTGRYVAMCTRVGRPDDRYDPGFEFVEFEIPKDSVENNSKFAKWYFLNKLEAMTSVVGVFPYENWYLARTYQRNGQRRIRVVREQKEDDGNRTIVAIKKLVDRELIWQKRPIGDIDFFELEKMAARDSFLPDFYKKIMEMGGKVNLDVVEELEDPGFPENVLHFRIIAIIDKKPAKFIVNNL